MPVKNSHCARQRGTGPRQNTLRTTPERRRRQINPKSPLRRQHYQDAKSSPTRPTVRSATIRKSAKDGGYTPTEATRKSRLMRQFSARDKGYAVAISQGYRDGYDAIDWGRGASVDDLKNCGGKK